MTIIQFDVSSGNFIQSLQRYSRYRANLSAVERLDYSANFPECPDELIGKGEAPLVLVEPTLGAGQKRGQVPDISTGSLVSGEWRVSVPAVSKSPEEIAAGLDAVLLSVKADIDRQAGNAALAFITDRTGQQGTYLRKDEETRAIIAKAADTGEGSLVEDDYPFIKREIAKLNARKSGEPGFTDWTLLSRATLIAGLADAWTVAGSEIEALRIDAKDAADDARATNDEEAIRAAAVGISWPTPG